MEINEFRSVTAVYLSIKADYTALSHTTDHCVHKLILLTQFRIEVLKNTGLLKHLLILVFFARY